MLYPAPGAVDFVLDAAETALALVPPSLLDKVPRAEQDEVEKDPGVEDEGAWEWREDRRFQPKMSRADIDTHMERWRQAVQRA